MDRVGGVRLSRGALAAALLLVGYGALLIANASHAVGGSDSSGYANTARLLASGKVSTPIVPEDLQTLAREDPMTFIPLAFVPGPEPGTMTPFYPVGFPLHIAAVAGVLGWAHGPFLASPLLALGCVVLVFLVGRELGLSQALALAAAALLGLCAVFLFMALQPMADVAATFWSLAAVWGGLRARKRALWAGVCGAAFGIAVLVRPTGALLLPALLFALPLRRRELAFFGLGGLPAAIVFGLYNRAAYGHPLRTGWVATELLDGFAWSHFVPRLVDYAVWLGKLLTPLVPVAWIAVLGDRLLERRNRALLFFWFAPYLIFHCFYAVYGSWWYTRFLLPGIPALVLAFSILLRDLSSRWRGRLSSAVIAGLVLVVLGWAGWQTRRLRVLRIDETQSVIPRSCAWAAARLPEKAVVVCNEMSGALRYYTGRQPVRWDWTKPETFPRLRAAVEAAGYRWYALLLRHEVKLAEPQVPGPWIFDGEMGPISLWRLEPAAGR